MQARSVFRVLLMVSLASFASGQDLKEVQARLNKTVNFGETAVSPDGQHVAWTERLHAANGGASRNSAIFISDLKDTSHPIAVSADSAKKPHAESELTWSPDSRTLVFASDAEQSHQPQLYSVSVDGTNIGAPKKLTSVKGDISSPRFSPDGKSLAFLFLEGGQAVGPLDAFTPEVGEFESHILEQRIAVLNLADGKVRTLSPADQFVYEYDWSPDGKQFAYTGAVGDGDNNWWIAKLYKLDAQTGQSTVVATPEAQIAEPHWSPDGRSIAYIGGLMSDQGVTGGDIYFAPSSGGSKPQNMTPGRTSSAAWLRWSQSGRLLFGEHVDGSTAISELDPTTKAIERLWQGDETLRGPSVAPDGRTSAAIRSSWEKAPEVWAGKVGAWSPVTSRNTDVKPAWGKTEKLHWQSGGHTVEGWLLYPANFDSSHRYGMVVSIHGGPASQLTPAWPASGYPILASQDFFVFFPNPRGSYGEGESFTRANVKDFGHGDLTDIMAGVDEVLKKAPVDPNRLGVGGWSYGGFMTMWTVTQTNRFHAAVAGAGIANWQSYYGQNLIDQWMIPYFGASVYDDPAVYAKSSPINYIKNVKTPTLVVVGERDAECPMPQSREFWHALRSLGVKTSLVVYPNEGHGFRDPEHIQDLNARTVAWFKDNLK